MKLKNSALLAIGLVVLVTGCELVPRALDPEEQAAVEQRAAALRSEGRFREAALEFLRLARGTNPPESHQFVLDAAAAYLEDGDVGAAKELLAENVVQPTAMEIFVCRADGSGNGSEAEAVSQDGAAPDPAVPAAESTSLERADLA